MRVTLDASSLLTPQAGIGRYTDQLVRALLAHSDAQLTLMCSYRPWAPRGLAALEAEYGPLGAAILQNPLPNRLLHASWDALNAPSAERLFGFCEVFHAPNFIAPPSRRVGIVSTVHDLTPILFPQWHTPYQRMIAHYLKKSVKRSHRLIVDSNSTAIDLIRLLDVPPEKVRVVPLAAAPHFHAPLAPEAQKRILENYDLDGGYFLFVGTLEPRKNLPRLLAAYKRLPAPLRSAHPLVLAGGRGWEDDALFKALEATPGVRVLGRVPDLDLPALMKGALAFVYPSLYEGFGLPVLEAMAAGAPVITSDAASLPEVAGSAALLVSPEDVEGLSAAMERLAGDGALRETLSVAGLKRAAEFSWEHTAALTFAVYEELA